MKHSTLSDSFARILPIVHWLPAYNPGWLRTDIMAGITLAAFTIPEAIAYAELAGLPAKTGLYASIIPALLYTLFGTSKQLVVGPTSAVSILLASGFAYLNIGSSDHYIALAAATALMVAVFAFVSYALRLGFIVNFISESVLVGFSIGAGLFIAATQLGKLFGIGGGTGGFFERLYYIGIHLGDVNYYSLGIGLIGIIILIAGEHLYRKMPWALIVVLGSIVFMSLTDLVNRGVHIIGTIPDGFPSFAVPKIELHDIPDLLRTAVGAFVLSYLEGMSMARTFASKHKTRIDPNQELLALGVSSLGAGFSQGYPVAGSFSRTALNDVLRAKTQLANGFCAITIAVFVIYFADFFTNLPEPILAAVVLTAVRGLFKTEALLRLFRFRRIEFWTAVGSLSGVLILGILDGVIIGAMLSLLLVIGRASQSKLSILGKVPDQPQFTNIEQNPENTVIPGLLIIRLEEGLFYANAEAIRDNIMDLIENGPASVQTVILDLEMTSDLDLPGAEMLADLHEKLSELGVHLRLSRVQRPARVLLARTGISQKIGLDRFHPRTLFAVASYLSEEGVSHAVTSDILPDMIRCVQDLISARAQNVRPSDRSRLQVISYKLEMILEEVEELNIQPQMPRSTGKPK